LVDLYGNAFDDCESSRERREMVQLLPEYKNVFRHGDHDMGLPKAVYHEIPLAAGWGSIGNPPAG